jgi:hypothetical protein
MHTVRSFCVLRSRQAQRLRRNADDHTAAHSVLIVHLRDDDPAGAIKRAGASRRRISTERTRANVVATPAEA